MSLSNDSKNWVKHLFRPDEYRAYLYLSGFFLFPVKIKFPKTLTFVTFKFGNN